MRKMATIKKEAGEAPDLEKRISQLLRDYSPSSDPMIETLLDALKKEVFAENSWAYVGKVMTLWHKRLDFFITELWQEISKRTTREGKLTTVKDDFLWIEKLLSDAKEDLYQYRHMKACFDIAKYQLLMKLLKSAYDDPPAEDEARFVREDDSRPPQYVITKIGSDDSGDDLTIITPLPELVEHEAMAQQLRDAGYIFAARTGYVIINDWIFPVIETEEGHFGIPIEKMLAKLGGCPCDFIASKYHAEYDFKDEVCRCVLRQNCCPGGNLLRTGTLSALAKKLRQIWKHKKIQAVIPGFGGKLLECK